MQQTRSKKEAYSITNLPQEARKKISKTNLINHLMELEKKNKQAQSQQKDWNNKIRTEIKQ